MPPKSLNFRLAIPSEFREEWDLFGEKAKNSDISTADLIRKLITEYLDNSEDDFDESAVLAELTGTQKSDDEVSTVKDEVAHKKKVVKKQAPAKKKSFLARRATITKKKVEEDEDDIHIQNTPKFRLLELVRDLDNGEGIDPETLVAEAEKARIPNPRLQMNKMIRRGILYVHLNRVHVNK